MEKLYLGDSVYFEFDGYHVVLTTDNGLGPSNTIALEPEVIRNFQLALVQLEKWKQQQQPPGVTPLKSTELDSKRFK